MADTTERATANEPKTAPSKSVAEIAADQKARTGSGSGRGGRKAAPVSDAPPISEAATLGQPEQHIVGGDESQGVKPLRIMLRAPVIAKGKALYQKIQGLPDVFIGAALSDMSGKGLDTEAVATFWNARMDAIRKIDTGDGSEGREYPVSTVETIRDELGAFTEALFSYEVGEENGAEDAAHPLDDYADIIWQLADGFNEGLTREALPAMMLDSLRPEDFADLTRAMFRACTGCSVIYEGSLPERF